MKHLTLNNLIMVTLVTAAIVFATFATIHIIHLSQAGLINWRS